MTRYDVLEIAEAANGYVKTKDLKNVNASTRYNWLNRLTKEGQLVRIKSGVYKLTTDGIEYLATKHFKGLENTRSQHYPGWQTVKPTVKEDVVVGSEVSHPEGLSHTSKDPVDWQREYIKLSLELAKALGNK